MPPAEFMEAEWLSTLPKLIVWEPWADFLSCALQYNARCIDILKLSKSHTEKVKSNLILMS